MHIVIMGCGRVGAHLAVELGKAGHSVAVVDKRKSAFDRLPPGFDAKTVVGMGFDREVLQEAGIDQAADGGAFIAVSNGDNSNIVAARVAREHFRVPNVIARIYDPRRAEIYEKLDIPTVSSVRWAAAQIQLLLFHDRSHQTETLGGGNLFLMRLPVPAHLVAKPVWALGESGSIRVVGVERGGGGFIPGRDSTFQGGDVMNVVVSKDAVARLDELLEPAAEE